MNRRPTRFGVLSVWLTFLLIGSSGPSDAAGLHRCPHHDIAVARPGDAPAAHEHAAAPAPHEDETVPCGCMGSCLGGAGAHPAPAAGSAALRLRPPGRPSTRTAPFHPHPPAIAHPATFPNPPPVPR